jgi:hypothetical protein
MSRQARPGRQALISCGLLLLAIMATACGSNPSESTPVEPPPKDTNTAPNITALTLAAPRVESDEEVAATATVEDAETPVDQLLYAWSAKPVNGTFTGSGRQVKWRAPRQQKTPDLYTVTLNVTEKYTFKGQPFEISVAKDAQLHYNDSKAEITALSKDFIEAKFGVYTVSPEDAVSNFSNSCQGKFDEMNDIRINRQLFQIQSATMSVDSISLNADKTYAYVEGACVFRDTVKSSGKAETVTGTCLLEATYEPWQWYLCVSHFRPSPASMGLSRYHHP